MTNEIHQRMLNEINNNLDKSNGGFIYDVTKAVALAIDNQSTKSESILDKLNVDNLTGEELRRFVFQRAGVVWKAPTFATTEVIFTGSVGTVIPIGSLVAADNVFYELITSVVIDLNGTGLGTVRCQLSGIVGNVPANTIKSMPVTISGITSVTNPNAVTNGYVGESDELLRQRYYDRLQRTGKAGNVYHYQEWAKSVVGVGKVKVYPLWAGALTVKVVVMDINGELPSSELLSNVENYIESEKPFGAILTVASPNTTNINVIVDITTIPEFTVEDVRDVLINNINDYLKSIVFESEYVSLAQIGRIILETDGIIDYTNLTLNDTTENVLIEDGYVPILGMVILL